MKKTVQFFVTIALCVVTIAMTSCHQNSPSFKRCNTQLSEWLYGVEYDDYDFDLMAELCDEWINPSGGVCTELRKGNFVGRNFDWFIDREATYLIKINGVDTAHAADLNYLRTARYASISNTGASKVFNQDVAKSGEFSKLYAMLLGIIVDGINEKGLYVGINAASTGESSYDPTLWIPGEWGIGAAYTNPGASNSVLTILLCRVLLDHASSVDEALRIVDGINWYDAKNFLGSGYSQSFQWLIADANKTCVLEFIENKWHATVSSDINTASLATITTNFSNALHEAGIIQAGGSGYERYDEAVAMYNDVPATESGMKKAMQDLWYTKIYTQEQNTPGYRYTDMIPDEVSTIDFFEHPEMKDDPELVAYINEQQELYRTRDGWYEDDCELYHTRHTVVYDLDNRLYHIMLHEGDDGQDKWFTMTMNTSFTKPLAK